jgi:hypothetical protein
LLKEEPKVTSSDAERLTLLQMIPRNAVNVNSKVAPAAARRVGSPTIMRQANSRNALILKLL